MEFYFPIAHFVTRQETPLNPKPALQHFHVLLQQPIQSKTIQTRKPKPLPKPDPAIAAQPDNQQTDHGGHGQKKIVQK